ncbi:MAG: sulfatase family protein [Pirellulaceae bacterium]
MTVFSFYILVIAFAFSGEAIAQPRPNIILINLDDADHEILSPENLAIYFPHMQNFANEGIRFTNFHVTTPLCGPSRASLLRGQYAHNTGIRTNGTGFSRSNGFEGGMALYGAKGYHEQDISSWMKAAGYRTMHVGKFLHGDVVDILPSGWDDFHASRGASYYNTWRFTNRFSPQGEAYQDPPGVYRTNQESAEVLELVDEHVARDNGQPFFMYYAPLAPHLTGPGESMVEPKYENWWPNARMYRPLSVNEWDFTDKSTAIRDIPRLSAFDLFAIDEIHRSRLLSLKSVDDLIADLRAKLVQHGLQDNTWILLTSDNGFTNGHHRLLGKADCFDRSSRVPMYVIGPGVPAGAEANHLLAHIDICPTIAQLAQSGTPPWVDGQSFTPLLTQPENYDERSWRGSIMIENWETRTFYGSSRNTASIALRNYDSVYSEWANGSPEFYNLANDPEQLNNIYDQLSQPQQELLEGYLRVFWAAARAPDTTITEPYDMNELINKQLPLRGMAEDDSGVSAVRLAIVRFSDWNYWNGSGWQPGRVVVDAELTNPGQQLTTWSYPDIPRGQPVDDMVGVWARAYDDSGQFDRSLPFVVFRVDLQRPASWITYPEANQTINLLEATGGSFDEGGVSFIRIVVRDNDNGMYFDGSQWVNNWTWFGVGAALNGTWSYTNDQLHGNLTLSTRAVDSSGNVQKPPSIIHFQVQ